MDPEAVGKHTYSDTASALTSGLNVSHNRTASEPCATCGQQGSCTQLTPIVQKWNCFFEGPSSGLDFQTLWRGVFSKNGSSDKGVFTCAILTSYPYSEKIAFCCNNFFSGQTHQQISRPSQARTLAALSHTAELRALSGIRHLSWLFCCCGTCWYKRLHPHL